MMRKIAVAHGQRHGQPLGARVDQHQRGRVTAPLGPRVGAPAFVERFGRKAMLDLRARKRLCEARREKHSQCSEVRDERSWRGVRSVRLHVRCRRESGTRMSPANTRRRLGYWSRDTADFSSAMT